MKSVYYFLFLSVFGRSLIFAQRPTIQTPEVSSINRFLDVPVDKSTGIPNITIPLYDVKLNGFSLPVSLSYHAGGIRVDEEASSVGLGWSLNAGGMISRTIKKQPDEMGGYYTSYGTAQPQDQASNITAPLYNPFIAGTVHDIVAGGMDNEPDLFYFYVNGLSGKFLFDKTRTPKLIPEQDIKIEVDQFFTEFKLINSDGAVYIFSSLETSSSTDQVGNTSGNYTSAWRLTQIITPNKESILFTYQNQGYSFQKTLPRDAFVSRNLECPGSYSTVFYAHVSQKNIQSITFNNGRIDFLYKNSYREDYVGNNGLSVNLMKALESVKVINTVSNEVIKQYNLNTSYFTSNSTLPYNIEPYLTKRLKLDQLVECGNNGSNCLPPYKFFYNKHNPTTNNYLPSRLSRGLDHWGFCNGADYNVSLYTGLNCGGNANRNPDPNYKAAYILDEIEYPTGGVKSLIYESTIIGGGLRVSQITDNPGAGQQTISKQYTYENSILTGGDPVYIQAIETSDVLSLSPHYSQYNLCWQFSPDIYPYYYVFQTPVNYTGEISANIVVHGKVTEHIIGQGYIESEFDVSHIDDEIDLEQAQTFPFVVTMPLLLTGNQIRETYKDEGGNVLKEILYNYSSSRTPIISYPDAYKVSKPLCMQQIRHYSLYSGFARLESKVERVNGNSEQIGLTSLETTTTYDYGGLSTPGNRIHHFITKETSTANNGTSLIKRYKFPLDYKAEIGTIDPSDVWDNASKGIQEMITQNRVSTPIEQIITRYKNGTEYVIGGSLSKFLSRTTSQNVKIVSLDNISKLNIQSPVTFSSNFFSAITKTGNSYQFNHNNNYSIEAEILKSDDINNVLEIKGKDGVSEAYLWAYGNAYPASKIINAVNKDIFYTSFEEGNGNSSSGDSKTGDKSKTDGFTTSLTNLTNGNYILTYWQKSGAIWILQENSIVVASGAYNISLTGQIDEVRFYPVNALMVTYTYRPLVGMTSQCDANNRVSYYEYDDFNRLVLIKDQDKNIIKKICYNYAGQQDNCFTCNSSNNTPDWQNIGSSWCQSGPCGNTGYQLQVQQDMNPCSPTYNQTQTIQVYNPSACTPGSGVTINYVNSTNLSGFTITYTDRVTGQPYSYTIPASGSGILGCIPSGSYTITISKPGNSTMILFGLGCTSQSGTSAYWGKISVPGLSGNCNMVTIDFDLQ